MIVQRAGRVLGASGGPGVGGGTLANKCRNQFDLVRITHTTHHANFLSYFDILLINYITTIKKYTGLPELPRVD